MKTAEAIKRNISWKVKKWNPQLGEAFSPTERFQQNMKPDEVLDIKNNLGLNAGLTELLKLISGEGSPTAYDNANAYLVVGNSSTAAAASQTDIQGASNLEKAMDSGYPSVSGQTATWKSTYGSSDANFAWEECGVKNGSGSVSATIIMMNRKVQSMGTKSSGAVWTLQLDITLS